MKQETKVLAGVLVFTLGIIFFGVMFLAKSSPQTSVTGEVYQIDYSKGHKIGSDSAKVRLVEFSDFQCPYCAKFFTETFSQIKKDYIDTGKVKLVYRDYPLDFHPNAQKAAEASECAHAQGKFWEMHDKLFQNQASLSIDNYKTWAKDLGLDTAKFNDCLDKGTYADEVKKDLADGQAAGVSGTPGFFVNHQIISGAVPYAVFKTAIDAELGAK